MKKLTLLLTFLMFGIFAFSQRQAVIPEKMKNLAQEKLPIASVDNSLNNNATNTDYKFGDWTEEKIGETVYDLQSNYDRLKRFYLFVCVKKRNFS
ncbi:MAG: hypothetical protein ABFS05_10030 [Bacteroidota bacterium]